MVLDGEIAGVRSRRPAILRRAPGARTAQDRARDRAGDRATPVVFFCFDMLHFAGLDVRAAPYADRRRWLEQCLFPSPHVQLVHAEEDGEELYKAGARERLRRRHRQAQGQASTKRASARRRG